jgi:hypothetical protein
VYFWISVGVYGPSPTEQKVVGVFVRFFVASSGDSIQYVDAAVDKGTISRQPS